MTARTPLAERQQLTKKTAVNVNDPGWEPNTLLRAKTSFTGAALVDGKSVEVDVHAGQVLRADDPAVAGRWQHFTPLDGDVQSSTGRRARTAQRTTA